MAGDAALGGRRVGRPPWPSAGGLAAEDQARGRAEHGEADDDGGDALAAERLDREVLGSVDAQQHDHEQEQHDDGAGVDDHLHDGQEVGLLATNSTATPNRVTTSDSAECTGLRDSTTPRAPPRQSRAADDEDDEVSPSVGARRGRS